MSQVMTLFRNIPVFAKDETVPEMRRASGSEHAELLLVTPVSTQQEYLAQVPYSRPSARRFHDLLARRGADSRRDFFIVPVARFGMKYSKAGVLPMTAFVEACAQAKLFKGIVCLGLDVFGHLYNRGAKVSSSVAGSIIRMGASKVPVFTFSDPTPLEVLDVERGRQKVDRETWLAIKQAEDLEIKLASQMELFINYRKSLC